MSKFNVTTGDAFPISHDIMGHVRKLSFCRGAAPAPVKNAFANTSWNRVLTRKPYKNPMKPYKKFLKNFRKIDLE